MGAGNKGAAMETDRKGLTFKMKDKLFIPPFSLRFVQEQYYIHLLLIKCVVSTLIRVDIEVRNLCVSLNVRMTFNSATSWIYQVLVLFVALINTNK